MKKTIFMSMLLFIAMSAMAQQPVITFINGTDHDFGKINEADGKVSFIFNFKNEGMEPLVLSNVKASCGCTTPTWTRTPVDPGQEGAITVTYNPNGRPGKFSKTVTITSNASEPTTKVYIRGEVIPKQAKPVDKYPVKMGDKQQLGFSGRLISFGSVKNTENIVRSIEYANLGEEDLEIEVLINTNDKHLTPRLSKATIKKGEAGTLSIQFNGMNCSKWGACNTSVFIQINGKREMSDAYKIDVNANLVEDFSALSIEQKQNAPILEVANEINLGEIAAGKAVKASLSIKNAGAKSALIVRRLDNFSDKNISLYTSRSIKSGKKGEIKVVVNTIGKDGHTLAAGTYRRQIEIITNDPNNSIKHVNVVWVVK